jgi:hypothetical protein
MCGLTRTRIDESSNRTERIPHANVKLIKAGGAELIGVSGEPDEIVSIGLIDFEPNEPPLPLRHKFENSLRYHRDA